MGRKSKLTEKQWDEIEHHPWREIATNFLNAKDDERKQMADRVMCHGT